MKEILPEKLKILAKSCPAPLYVVGGCTRDYLAGLKAKKRDIDLCAPISADEFVAAAEKCGFAVRAVYRNTGTVKLQDENRNDYEYTCFRSDRYVRGTHVPVEIFFTDDILSDAKRRDFTVNAIYYDVAGETFVDPLGGREDVLSKRMRTVDDADKVFGEDGLRLMRLARQSGQLGFTPSDECMAAAKANAALIADISPERIYTELNSILYSSKKYGAAIGPYRGLKILDETRVLDRILPELAAGRDMTQRSDYHDHDVLDHSFRAATYAVDGIRMAALLHDAGKPFCMKRDGNFYAHASEGARIAGEILTRLKAPTKELYQARNLIFYHMYDFDGQVKANKLKRFFVAQPDLIPPLMQLKQADYSACKDDTSVCPANRKWQRILGEMRAAHTPFKVGFLALSGRDVATATGMQPKYISAVLKEMLLHCAVYPADNSRERLTQILPACLKTAIAEVSAAEAEKAAKRAAKADKNDKNEARTGENAPAGNGANGSAADGNAGEAKA